MKIDRIKWTQEFSINGLSYWPGMEASLDETDNAEECLLLLATKLKALHEAQEKDAYGGGIVKDRATHQPEIDLEFEVFKQQLSLFKYKEEAEAALVGSGYSSLNVEIKKIIENLPTQGQA